MLGYSTIAHAFSPQKTSFVVRSSLFSDTSNFEIGGPDEDDGNEFGFNEPNPYADQYVAEDATTLVTEAMEEVMGALDLGAISSEDGYVAAATKRAQEARNKLSASDEGNGGSDAGTVQAQASEYKSSVLLSPGAKAEVEASASKETSGDAPGIKEASRSQENSDILFVDGDDDDGSLLVF